MKKALLLVVVAFGFHVIPKELIWGLAIILGLGTLGIILDVSILHLMKKQLRFKPPEPTGKLWKGGSDGNET